MTLIFCPGLRLFTPKPAEFPEGFGLTFVGAFDVTLKELAVGFGVAFTFEVGFGLGRELPSTTVTLIFCPGLMLFTVTELFEDPFEFLGGAISSGFFSGDELADGVALRVEVGVAEGFGVAFGEAVGFGEVVGLGLADGEGLGLAEGDGVGFAVVDAEGEGVGFAVGDAEGEGVGVGVGVTTFGAGALGVGATGVGAGAETAVKVIVSTFETAVA